MKRITIGIGTKIYVGFAGLIVLGVMIGIAGFLSLTRVTTTGNISNLAHSVQIKIAEARYFEKEYLIKKDEESFGRLNKCLDELSALAGELKAGTDKGTDAAAIDESQQIYRLAMAEIKKLEEDDSKNLKDLQILATGITWLAEEDSTRTSETIKSDIMTRNAKALKDYALQEIKNITTVGCDVLQHYSQKGLPREEALEAVRNLHFDGRNYFFVVQEDLTLIAHGSDRNLEGKDFGKIQDKKTGKTFMKEVVESAIRSGESYTEYSWNKPGMGDAVFPKVTFAKYFQPWGLVICAGVYIDDIEKQVAETGKLVSDGLDQFQHAADIKSSMLEARLNSLYFFAFGQNADKVPENITQLKQMAKTDDKLVQKADKYLENFNRSVQNSSTRANRVVQIDTAAEKTTQTAGGIGAQAQDVFSSTASGGKRFISAFILIGALIGIVLATVLARSIIRPIKRAIEGIVETSEQVASSSSQVSSSSRQLAEGASEQAASLEETSSALEEMTSMTKQNADNATHANELTMESGKIVEEANQTMSRLTASMIEISKASEQTQKIVKTIDEIAFQTNLLALNAAVEAARAGEAGAGFAVVADEVRNLAMRAAEAARNTAGMIESTVARIKEGSSLVEKTNLDFQRVAGCVTKSGQLIGEIAAASNEQAQGIVQINGAISEMDRVVQQNSTNAEESASASQQMDSQARNLEKYLRELETLVGGHSNGKTHNWKTKAEQYDPPQQEPDPAGSTLAGKVSRHNGVTRTGAAYEARLQNDSRKNLPLREDFGDDF